MGTWHAWRRRTCPLMTPDPTVTPSPLPMPDDTCTPAPAQKKPTPQALQHDPRHALDRETTRSGRAGPNLGRSAFRNPPQIARRIAHPKERSDTLPKRAATLTDHLAVGEVGAGALRRHLPVVHHLLRACPTTRYPQHQPQWFSGHKCPARSRGEERRRGGGRTGEVLNVVEGLALGDWWRRGVVRGRNDEARLLQTASRRQVSPAVSQAHTGAGFESGNTGKRHGE
jgi:hypothetical protein